MAVHVSPRRRRRCPCRDGSRAFASLQGRHCVVSVPIAGRETVEVRIQGRGGDSAVPIKRMSNQGGDYLR
jgi:hypothetical protein